MKEREEQIARLNDQLKGVEDDKAKEMKRETQLNLLKKCNDELKCTVCDELFVTVSINYNLKIGIDRVLDPLFSSK